MTDELSRRLDAFMDSLLERADPQTVRILRQAAEALDASGISARAPKRGDIAPDFVLPDAEGNPVSLSELRRHGPVVLMFFRGGWCPFCAQTMRAMNAVHPDLRAAGAELVGISPMTGQAASATKERHFLSWPMLTDAGNEVARRYGLVWQLSPDLREVYDRLGHRLPLINGTEDWTLPIPAGFVIAPDGRIAVAHVDTRVTSRLDPRRAVAAVREVSSAAAAPQAVPVS